MPKLKSDFTFGFEFEGFARLNSYVKQKDLSCNYSDDFDKMSCNSLDGDDYRYFYNRINDFINGKLKTNTGRTHYDGSVKNYLNGYQSFEYSSRVYNFTPKNLNLLYNFFSNLKEYDMGINDTCGFHTHISYRNINEMDAIWIICQIAFNKNWFNEVSTFEDDDKTLYKFYSDRYADREFLNEIQVSIKSQNFSHLRCLLNNDKYRVLRIHPQGTIEWRGPRKFLELKDGFNKYIKKLDKILDIFCQALNKKTLGNNNITKEMFFDSIKNTDLKVYHNGFFFNIHNKFVKRQHLTGCLSQFGSKYTSHNLFTDLSKIEKAIKNNVSIVYNKDLSDFKTFFISRMNTVTFTNFINYSKKLMYKLDKETLTIILYKNGSLLNDVAPLIDSIIDTDYIINAIDGTKFLYKSDNYIYEYYKNILMITDKNSYARVFRTLVSNDFRFKQLIELDLKIGKFKNINLTQYFNNNKYYYNTELVKDWYNQGLMLYDCIDISTNTRYPEIIPMTIKFCDPYIHSEESCEHGRCAEECVEENIAEEPVLISELSQR